LIRLTHTTHVQRNSYLQAFDVAKYATHVYWLGTFPVILGYRIIGAGLLRRSALNNK